MDKSAASPELNIWWVHEEVKRRAMKKTSKKSGTILPRRDGAAVSRFTVAMGEERTDEEIEFCVVATGDLKKVHKMREEGRVHQ